MKLKAAWKALLEKIKVATVLGIPENKMTDDEAKIAVFLLKENLVIRRFGDVGKALGFIYYDVAHEDRI
jgi:hypothetical protein